LRCAPCGRRFHRRRRLVMKAKIIEVQVPPAPAAFVHQSHGDRFAL
jgi:hypothetical protein